MLKIGDIVVVVGEYDEFEDLGAEGVVVGYNHNELILVKFERGMDSILHSGNGNSYSEPYGKGERLYFYEDKYYYFENECLELQIIEFDIGI